MSFTEDEIKKAADLKLWLENRINELRVEIDKLQQMLVVANSVLRRTSFRSAMEEAAVPVLQPQQHQPRPVVQPTSESEYQETRQIKSSKDGFLLATAYISPAIVAIVPVSDVRLSTSIPPFKSFFLNRILEGMKAKDSENVAEKKLDPSQVLSFSIDEENGAINKIVINNYRDSTRLNEIINTVTWVFTRMLEKVR